MPFRVVPVLRTMTEESGWVDLPRPCFGMGTRQFSLKPRKLGRIVHPKHATAHFRRGSSVDAVAKAVVAELTVSQKIILAAYHLEEKGNTPFTPKR